MLKNVYTYECPPVKKTVSNFSNASDKYPKVLSYRTAFKTYVSPKAVKFSKGNSTEIFWETLG